MSRFRGKHFNSNSTTLTRKLVRWFQENARDLPWRKTNDPYAIWISEIMLQQTQVKTVIPYWERWMRLFPNVCDISRSFWRRSAEGVGGIGVLFQGAESAKGGALDCG